MKKKNLSEVKVYAKNGKVWIYIKVNKIVSGVFRPDKNLSVGTSNSWKTKDDEPLEFYELDPETTSNRFLLSNINTNFQDVYFYFNQFGGSLMRDTKDINASILRSVGIENGITLVTDSNYTSDELKFYCESLGKLIRWTYQTQSCPITIDMSVTKGASDEN